MNGLLRLAQGIDALSETVGRAVKWLILAAVLVSAGNAVVRKVLSTSSNAWLELQWYLFGAAFMLASAQVLKNNEHIRIDIVYGAFRQRTRQWIDLFGHVFFLLPFVAVMSWMLVPYAWAAWRSGQISTNAGGLMIWPARAILAAGFLLLLAQAVSEIIKKIAILQGRIPDPHVFMSAHEAAEAEGRAMAESARENAP